MTDLHTHILPGVDDGASTVDDSIAMLHAQHMQGVDTVVLTPHFYPDGEDCSTFLRRRNAAWEQLSEAINALDQARRQSLPRLVLGAEVAYLPGLQDMDGLEKLCIGGTKNMLLELPFYPWDRMLINGIYDFFGHSGVTPILAHIERYVMCQRRILLDEVFDMGLPVQVGTGPTPRAFGLPLRLLKHGRAHLIASDCHNMSDRSPNLMQAMEIVRKKLGQECFEEIAELTDQLAME